MTKIDTFMVLLEAVRWFVIDETERMKRIDVEHIFIPIDEIDGA